MKRSQVDYLDPVLGFSRTMETLTRNSELIIIPKMPPRAVAKPNFTNNNNNSSSNCSSNKNNGAKSTNNIGLRKIQPKDTESKDLTSEMISSIIQSCRNKINENQMNGGGVGSTIMPPQRIKSFDNLNGAMVKINDMPNLRDQPTFGGVSPSAGFDSLRQSQFMSSINLSPAPQVHKVVNKPAAAPSLPALISNSVASTNQPPFMLNPRPPLNSVNVNSGQQPQITNIAGKRNIEVVSFYLKFELLI